MTTEVRMNEQKPRTELGRLAESLGLSMREVPSPPGTAPWDAMEQPESPESPIRLNREQEDTNAPIPPAT
jgi:hypothetical protein